jgi:hypothetical protein
LYWLLIGALPPLLAAPAATPAPPMEPTARVEADEPTRKRSRRPRTRARTAVVAAVAAVVVVAVAVVAVAYVPPLLNRDRDRAPGTAAGTGPGAAAGAWRRPCQLLGNDEVNRTTGTTFEPCREAAVDLAGAPKLFGPDFDALYEGQGCVNGQWQQDVNFAYLQTCQYQKPAEAFQAAVKLVDQFFAGTSFSRGTVAGLGDESFTGVYQVVPSVPPGVFVFVRKGTVLFSISCLYPGSTLDAAVTLARTVAGRLP